MSRVEFHRPTTPASVDYDPFDGGELALVVPTTESQREIWIADQYGRDASLSFNLSVSLQLRGSLDAHALQAALQDLVDRHDALRASIGPDGESFCVLKQFRIPLQSADLAALDTTARQAEIAERIRSSVETPFELARGPLLRAELLRLGADEHLLLLTAHHIVCDGWSWWVLVRELGALYGQRCGVAGEEPLAMPASSASFCMSEPLGRMAMMSSSSAPRVGGVERSLGGSPERLSGCPSSVGQPGQVEGPAGGTSAGPSRSSAGES